MSLVLIIENFIIRFWYFFVFKFFILYFECEVIIRSLYYENFKNYVYDLICLIIE